MAIAVGDKVRYVPCEAHAMDLLEDGTRCWDFESTNEREKGRALADRVVAQLLSRARGPHTRAAPVRPLAPRCCWPAVVRGIRPTAEGQAHPNLDLDIEGRPPGCTFHYDNIPYAPAADNVPHTWHTAEEMK